MGQNIHSGRQFSSEDLCRLPRQYEEVQQAEIQKQKQFDMSSPSHPDHEPNLNSAPRSQKQILFLLTTVILLLIFLLLILLILNSSSSTGPAPLGPELEAIQKAYEQNLTDLHKELQQKNQQIDRLTLASNQNLNRLVQKDKELRDRDAEVKGFRDAWVGLQAELGRLEKEKDMGRVETRQIKEHKLDYRAIRDQIEKSLVYQQENFTFNKAFESLPQLNLSQTHEIIKYEEEEFAIKLAEHQIGNQTDQKIWKEEYRRLEAKYNLSQVKEELPICVVVEDDAAVAEENAHVLGSLERQNYTNFHVVWIQEGAGAREEQKWPDNRVKNRLKVVKNQQKQGTTANLYFWGSKFCGKDDIVVPLGKGAGLLGRQSLKILNSVYQSPQVMFTRSPVLLKRSEYDLVSSQLQEPQEELSKVNRKYSKKSSVIKSFRRKLLDSMPFENLLNSTYNEKANVSSLFFESDSNVFPLYAGIESVAKGKSVELKQYLQVSYRVEANCQKAHQEFIKAKAPLNAQSGEAEWKQFLSAEKDLQKCIEKYRQKIEFNLENPIRVVYGDKIYKRTIYNEKGVNRTMGKNPKFLIDLKKYLPKILTEWRSFKPSQVKNQSDLIYTLTFRDLQTIVRSNRIDFQSIKHQLQSQFSFQILQFPPSPTQSPPSPSPVLNLTHLTTPQQAHTFLSQTLPARNVIVPNRTDIGYQLAYRMQLFPDEPEVVESEYYFVDWRYGIGRQRVQDEIPICVVSTGYKIRNRKNGTGDGYLYQTYFRHLETLNYTNYHVVYIDDASPDGSAEFIYEYVNNSTMKVKNRMKIVHMLQNIGVTANTFFWPQKLCGPDQIVVLCDADDNLLGRQSLRIFNHLYKNPNTWYAFTRHLRWYQNFWRWRGRSFGEKNIYVRWTEEWAVANTKTFRAKLMHAVPFYQYIQYHYDPRNLTAWPVFQDLSPDGLQVSANVQLAGNARIAYYDGITHAYSGTSGTNKCYEWTETYDWRKTMTRSRLQVLGSLDEKGKLTQGQEYQWKYHFEAKRLAELLEKNKCYRK